MNLIYVYFLPLAIALCACGVNKPDTDSNPPTAEAYLEVRPSFQHLLDTSGLTGSILLYDPQKRTYYSNDFQWAGTGQLPASTFKIANSIIALETGVIKNEQFTLPWDGTTRSIANWNQDLSFDKAFAFSCVPCYQQIARDIGPLRMRKQLDRLGYPGISFRQNEIDMFWLRGASRINQFEQVEFLQRLHEGDLPISSTTARIMQKIMVIDTTDSYVLSGKTGWSNDNEHDNGWFVGFVERLPDNNSTHKEEILYFATNVEPKQGTPIASFISGRRASTEAAIALLEWK